MCEHEAIVDICVRLATFRNLSENYLSKCYFKLAITAGSSPAAPYQIIPYGSNTLASISLHEYISPLFTLGPYAKCDLSQLAVFKALVPLGLLESAELRVSFQLIEVGSEERQLQAVTLEYISVVGLNSYMPVCFSRNKCAIDAVISTQFLSCRFRNILIAPKPLLYTAVEGLLISFNRLRERLSRSKDSCEYGVQSFPEMEQIRRFTKTRIFQQGEEEQRTKLLQFEMKLPKVSFCVQQLWGKYLSVELQTDIEKYRSNFLKSYALQVSHAVYVREQANDAACIVDSLKLPSYPLTVKTILKKEAESFHKGDGSTTRLVFLVHGFGASSKTLEQLELGLCFFYPHLHVVSSKANENRTDDSLHEMGKRLAMEVEASLEALHTKDNFSLSFIGHSLGGLIIRAALPFLEHHRYNMRLYVSLGTPHLGYLYHNSKLTKFGMWTYSLFKRSPAMSTLLMDSSPNLRLSPLYELTTTVGLNWFEEVLLYAGLQDYFVSEESALMQANQQILEDYGRGLERASIWEEMRNNLNEQLECVGVSKYMVNFERENMLIQGSMADELLGRRNHINLTNSSSFILALLLAHSSKL